MSDAVPWSWKTAAALNAQFDELCRALVVVPDVAGLAESFEAYESLLALLEGRGSKPPQQVLAERAVWRALAAVSSEIQLLRETNDGS